MRTYAFIVIAALLTGASGQSSRDLATLQQTFRIRTSAVGVNVSVLDRMNPVPGLEAGDFNVFDNGVLQQVKFFGSGSVPMDVTAVVDVSFGAFARLDEYRAEVARLGGLLRSTDNLRILSFGSLVTTIQPMTPGTVRPPVERLQTSRQIALNNALIAALLRPPVSDRRHLVVAFVPTVDGDSVITGSTVLDVARQADAVLHVVLASWKPSSQVTVAEGPRIVFRNAEEMRDILKKASEATGGEMRELSGSIFQKFQQVFEQFRTSYLLTYEPSGVPVGGWHTIEVRLKQPKSYRILARSGYFGG
jgi:VWFA-related protein